MPTEPILTTDGLTKRFGGFTAVKDLTLSVAKGSIHALIGPNGAGKTTVFNLLTKTLQPTSGRIVYNGEDITRRRPYEVARIGMVRSFQISAVFPRLTVRENVRLALQDKAGESYAFWRSGRSLARLDARVDELLELVDLSPYADDPAVRLPYGRKRALEIATTIALEPNLLLLDEPMAGLSREDIQRVADLIRRLSVDRTILMVEHNLSVVADLSDRITVLTRGQILAEGSYAEVSRVPAVQEAYLGGGHA
ncbi:ABC transporter ATP-binding protein [Chelatococcus sp. GCM10030263]|uniref:ABC transporter ATP-binding protein n=1 Tax=Chelatococcus sp. GCM10030263 TaxID=3273387 RepID=UPI0036153A65